MSHEGPVVTQSFVRFEQQHIMPIPENERTGTNWSVFSIWVSLNMMPLAVITGAIASGHYSLPIGWSIAAVLLGNFIGSFGSALHGSQGPHLGIPQMLQARGQFGYQGGTLFALIAFVMFMGFFSSILIVARDSLQVIYPNLNGSLLIIAFGIIGTVLCVYGYDMLRRTMSWLSLIIGIAVAVSMIMLAFTPEVTSRRDDAVFTFEGFFAMLAIGVVWQLAYAPYVSDYTRYLPKTTGPKTAFWSTYLGLVLSSVFVMSLGVLLGAGATDPDNPLGALMDFLGPIGVVVLIIFALSSPLINGVELYSAVMNALTSLQSSFKGLVVTSNTRVWTTIASGALGTGLALIFGVQEDFLGTFEAFLDILLYILIPWSAINLVDYFIIKKGNYVISDLFMRDGGRYGKWNAVGLWSYFLGLSAQVPFMSIAAFEGPFAKLMQGIDVAWLVGFVVTGLIFLVLMKIFGKPEENNPEEDELEAVLSN